MYLRKLIQTSIGLGKRSQLIQSLHFSSAKSTESKLRMAEKASGKYLPEILTKLEEFAPLALAESWDNVGLLVDPLERVLIQNILLTNDLTEDVLEEAQKLNVGLIISYHPNIFQGLKSVSGK